MTGGEGGRGYYGKAGEAGGKFGDGDGFDEDVEV